MSSVLTLCSNHIGLCLEVVFVGPGSLSCLPFWNLLYLYLLPLRPGFLWGGVPVSCLSSPFPHFPSAVFVPFFLIPFCNTLCLLLWLYHLSHFLEPLQPLQLPLHIMSQWSNKGHGYWGLLLHWLRVNWGIPPVCLHYSKKPDGNLVGPRVTPFT